MISWRSSGGKHAHQGSLFPGVWNKLVKKCRDDHRRRHQVKMLFHLFCKKVLENVCNLWKYSFMRIMSCLDCVSCYECWSGWGLMKCYVLCPSSLCAFSFTLNLNTFDTTCALFLLWLPSQTQSPAPLSLRLWVTLSRLSALHTAIHTTSGHYVHLPGHHQGLFVLFTSVNGTNAYRLNHTITAARS